jgi:hypothetical protein
MGTNFNVIEVTQKIEKILDQLAKTDYADNIGNGKWTAYILEKLRILGHECGLQVCPDYDNNNRAWLYDMTWYKNNNEGFLVDVPFVVESEWKYNDVQYDFEKLVQSNAKLKLMICCFNSKKGRYEELQKYFSDAINAFTDHAKGSKYMIAILQDWTPFEFHYSYYDLSSQKNLQNE